MSGSTKSKKYMKECFRYHIENDDVDEAFNICDTVLEADVKDKIRKIYQYTNKSVHLKDIVDVFGHITHIQSLIKKANWDKFFIYK